MQRKRHRHNLFERSKFNPQLFNSTLSAPRIQSFGAFVLGALTWLRGCKLRSVAIPCNPNFLDTLAPLFSAHSRHGETRNGCLAGGSLSAQNPFQIQLAEGLRMNNGAATFLAQLLQSSMSTKASSQQSVPALPQTAILCPLVAVNFPRVLTPVTRSCLIKCIPFGDRSTK